MSHETGDQPASDPDHSSEAPGHVPGLLESARLLERELRAIVHDHLMLAALETRRAGESLVAIIVIGILVAGVLLTAWLALVGALLVTLVQAGLVGAGTALLMVFALHGLTVWWLLSAIRKRSRDLMFPATIGQIRPAPSARTERSTSS